MPDPATSSSSAPRRRPSPWLIVPAAVVAGLMLFVLVWLVQREPTDTDDPALAADTAGEQAAAGPTLPAPQIPEEMSADTGDGDGDGGVFILPPAPAEPPRGIAGEPPPLPAPQLEQQDVVPPVAGDARVSGPRPIHSPAPTYPRSALRRGHSGEVLVRALVGVDGRPRQVEVIGSSSHRALDQAALRAVRNWRFQPAMQDGQPVAEPVEIPVEFNP
ncbi:energy transducer TonB [Luteimonas sp. A277]